MLPNTINGTCFSSLGKRIVESTSCGGKANISSTLSVERKEKEVLLKASVWIDDGQRKFAMQLNHEFLMALRNQLNQMVESCTTFSKTIKE